ncbi:anthranilate synthase component I [Cytobacillus gottheilii]|uniref:anthranilate synthase component I n=1 Tax=Cytobacillus gottheilii TaxID=859144 RepID=UPI0009B95A42|nr:anthranilate synthase component I [Cytobacillus gottheilii]
MIDSKKKLVVQQLSGDTLTPISIYMKLKGSHKFIFESSLKHENSGRYSIIGANPVVELKGREDQCELIISGDLIKKKQKPLEALKELLPITDERSDLPFCGGAVGFAGYDAVRQYENLGQSGIDELELPDVHFLLYEEVVVFDHLEQKVYLAGYPIINNQEKVSKSLTVLQDEILSEGAVSAYKETKLSSFSPSMTKTEYEKIVKKAKKYIEEGDIFQVVLSQRFTADFKGDPFSFYRDLRISNPSPYLYYLDYGPYSVAGASPESLVKVSGNKVLTNPIAGTRPRGKTEEEDMHLEKDLLTDEKELAEHMMLLDLGRNDIGRVAQFGSVKIDKNMQIERFKHVMHIVSEVSGTLKEDTTAFDALIACLPAGTVSGAPKVRAMEIINELETLKRGLYSGAVGYFSITGNMDFALAIRTVVLQNDKAYIQAGAGIVHDSIPENEYKETIHKLKAFMEDDHDFNN